MEIHLRRKLILFLFFLSGTSGLMYQVLWVRMLGLIFGNTTYAVSTVLSVFMGGLALGSWFFGKKIGSLSRFSRFSPLKIYGYLIVGIGIYGFFTPILFKGIESIYILMAGESESAYSIMRFILVCFSIVIPSILIGGTLPVIAKYFTGIHDSASGIGTSVGILYSINTWGAVLGAFLTGYILIIPLGVKGTLYLASAINLLIGGVVFVSAKKFDADFSLQDKWHSVQVPVTRKHYVILIAVALSGFTALAYEVAWTRVLSMVFGSSVYAFATMLCAFLAGIAIGSMIYAKFSFSPPLSKWIGGAADAVRPPLGQTGTGGEHTVFPAHHRDGSLEGVTERRFITFGLIQAGIGVSVLLLIPVFGILPVAFLKLFQAFGQNFAGFQFFQFLMALGVMLIPTTLFGMTVPLACAIYSNNAVRCFRVIKSEVSISNLDVGISVGNVYAANTTGAILGSLLAGFCFIPLIGMQKTIMMAAMVNVGLAIILINLIPERKWTRSLATCFLLFFCLSYAIFVPEWNKKIILSGVYNYAPEYSSRLNVPGMSIMGMLKHLQENKEILYYREGRHFTVSVEKQKFSRLISLKIDGKIDASSDLHGDMINQILMGHLPLLLHPSPENVMVLGLASGVTLGAVTLHKEPRNIDGVEIEDAMIEASRYFDEFNHQPLKDPRVNLIINDGRNHLLITNKKYDVIISGPSNPWVSGQSNLFTEEFFQLVKKHLKENGVFCQHLQEYNLTPKMYKIVLNTFQSVFPHTSVWETSPGDTVLIATSEPLKIDYNRLVQCMQNQKIRENLYSIGINSPVKLLTMIFAEKKTRELTRDSKLHTDNFPRLEYSSGKHMYYMPKLGVKKMLNNNMENISPYLQNFSDYEELIKLYLNRNLFAPALSELKLHALKIEPARRHNLFGWAYMGKGEMEKAEHEFKNATKINRKFYPAWINLSLLYRRKGDYPKAEKILKHLIENKVNAAHSEMGYLYLAQNKPHLAIKEFEKAISLSPESLQNYLVAGRIYIDYLKIPPAAIFILEEARERFPDSSDVYYLLEKAYLMMGADGVIH